MKDEYKLDGNSITIYKLNIRGDSFKVFSKHEFFKNEYIKVKVSDDFISFNIPSLNYLGKSFKTQKHHRDNKCFHFSITDDRLKEGKFYINQEESTEDELIVYYK